MASGIILASGQTFALDAMKYYIDNVTSGLYVGLMTNTSTPAENAQLPTASGITEIDGTSDSGSGYWRLECDTWEVTPGVDPLLAGNTVIFTVASGTWNANGYFVSATADGNDVLWAEVFPPFACGGKTVNETISITPIYEQKYYLET